jgi:thiol-disulfide isomerase/thioredoxin
MLRRLLLTVMVAGFVLMLQPGCGGGAKAPIAARPDTALQTGAVCDTTLAPDSTSTAAAVVRADTAPKPKPKPATPDKPAKVMEKSKELPGMWDFGSVSCQPCKTMKEILDPMMADYKGKVDIRIVDVYEDKERTRQFRIVTIPTQVFIDAEGKELFRHIGVYPRDSIETKFKGFGFPVVPGKSTSAPAPATGGT